jgi:antitoxin ParD1/3/4
MRTNIDIDDPTLEAAMRAGPYKTKKEAVEAGLKLLARQAAYREMLKWEGKLPWDGDSEPNSAVLQTSDAPATAAVPGLLQARAAVKQANEKVFSGSVSSKKSKHGGR